jgi:hypothetical protein
MANLNTTQAQFFEVFQRVRQRWEGTKSVWNDRVRWDFDKNHWTPLESQTQEVLKEMERLAQLIAQAQRSVK